MQDHSIYFLHASIPYVCVFVCIYLLEMYFCIQFLSDLFCVAKSGQHNLKDTCSLGRAFLEYETELIFSDSCISTINPIPVHNTNGLAVLMVVISGSGIYKGGSKFKLHFFPSIWQKPSKD